MTHLESTPSLDHQALDDDEVHLTFEEDAYVTIVSKRLGLGCHAWNPDDHAHWLHEGKNYTIYVDRPREYSIHGPDDKLIARLKLDEFQPSAYCKQLARACS